LNGFEDWARTTRLVITTSNVIRPHLNRFDMPEAVDSTQQVKITKPLDVLFSVGFS